MMIKLGHPPIYENNLLYTLLSTFASSLFSSVIILPYNEFIFVKEKDLFTTDFLDYLSGLLTASSSISSFFSSSYLELLLV